MADTFIHPNYTYQKFAFDIGLIKLTSPLEMTSKVQPVALNEEIVEVGTICTASGWGVTSEGALLLSSELRKV